MEEELWHSIVVLIGQNETSIFLRLLIIGRHEANTTYAAAIFIIGSHAETLAFELREPPQAQVKVVRSRFPNLFTLVVGSPHVCPFARTMLSRIALLYRVMQ